ncbi:hypothetical protein ACO1PF_05995 [Alkalibacterium sp. f15]|uniref:hypothetical protein n=1 Tax=Alkalibacterium sp. f15 TaxID=3414029 RepID=UPI003BF8D151
MFQLLHYYHSRNPEEASAVGVAVLDDLLSLLHFGLKDKGAVNVILVQATRSSIETYLDTLTSVFIHSSEKEPNRPSIKRLDDSGIPFVSEDVFQRELDVISKRRMQLLGAVNSDNHDWPKAKD